MLETAENLRRQYAHLARRAGRAGGRVAPAGGRRAEGRHVRRGDHPGHGAHARARRVIDTDEHPRADTSVESLGKLKPVLGKDDPDATVTAGNSSGQNDAASMCMVTTPEKAAELGLDPLVRLVSWGWPAWRPNIMGIGPVPATEVALAQGRTAARRHGPDRAQRGVRRPGAGGDAGMEVHRRRSGAHQRARLGHLARPPGRRDRRADAGDAGPRTAPPRRPLRPGDHVHRRRAGPGRGVRKGGAQ